MSAAAAYDFTVSLCPVLLYFGPAQLFYELYQKRAAALAVQQSIATSGQTRSNHGIKGTDEDVDGSKDKTAGEQPSRVVAGAESDVTVSTVASTLASRSSVVDIFNGTVEVDVVKKTAATDSGAEAEGAKVVAAPPAGGDGCSGCVAAACEDTADTVVEEQESSSSSRTIGGRSAEGDLAMSRVGEQHGAGNITSLTTPRLQVTPVETKGATAPALQEEDQLLRLATPPLQFVAQVLNGYTWLLCFLLEGMITGVVPCAVQWLTGVVWLFLYVRVYRRDLYAAQLRLQLRLLAVAMGLLTLLFLLPVLFDGYAILEPLQNSIENGDEGRRDEGSNNANTAGETDQGSLTRSVKTTFAVLTVPTFLLYMGAPARYAHRSYVRRDPIYMGGWVTNAAGVLVCGVWTYHGAVSGLPAVALSCGLSTLFSLTCVALRGWLLWR